MKHSSLSLSLSSRPFRILIETLYIRFGLDIALSSGAKEERLIVYLLYIKEWERERFLGQKQLKPTQTDIYDALLSLSLQQQQHCVFCSFEEEEEGKRLLGARTTEPRGEEAEEG